MREWLVDLRNRLGLNQQQMADRLGITAPYLCYIEHGNRKKSLDLDFAAKIVETCGMTIEQIYEAEKGRF